jgi:hypothetical protein
LDADIRRYPRTKSAEDKKERRGQRQEWGKRKNGEIPGEITSDFTGILLVICGLRLERKIEYQL